MAAYCGRSSTDDDVDKLRGKKRKETFHASKKKNKVPLWTSTKMSLEIIDFSLSIFLIRF
jgi:hypothetical protein